MEAFETAANAIGRGGRPSSQGDANSELNRNRPLRNSRCKRYSFEIRPLQVSTACVRKNSNVCSSDRGHLHAKKNPGFLQSITSKPVSDFRRYIGDEMVALLRLIPGTVVLMISASLIPSGDEVDPGQNGSKKNQNGVEVLVREMRARIARTIDLRQQTGLQSNPPKFEFDVFADEHGLDESCQAVVTLLRDPDSLVREEAAKVAADWLKADDLDEDTLQNMLGDSSFEVRRLALKLLPESGLSLEPLFLIANDNSSDFQPLAMELLVPLIMKGNNEAKAVLSELITSTEARTAGQAILLTGTLKVQGRFAESKLREALSDERSFTITYLTAMCLSGESFSIDQLAAEALRETGFDDEATAEALRKVCDSSREKFATVKDENSWLAFDSRPWLSAAVTLAVRRRDFASIREAIFLRGHGSYRFN